MAIICVTVFVRPQMFAATTFPELIATRRIDVTRNSLSRTIITGTELIKFKSTKQINADITSILSASGSKNLPKFVIWPYFLASLPSKWSVSDATKKTIKARKNRLGIDFTSRNTIKIGIRNILNIVILLGILNKILYLPLQCQFLS